MVVNRCPSPVAAFTPARIFVFELVCPSHQLSLSRAEACEMAVEDCASSAWNAERRSQLRRRVRQAWVRSTPVQRAMDPGGIAAARALLRASSPESQRNASFAVYPESAESERSATNDSKKMLATEQTRRRECCKHHLPAVYAGASRLRKNYNRAATTTKTLGITFVGLSDSHDSCITSREEASLQGERTLPVKERLGPAERDGAERELAMDMLSHLGPLQDLTELDLCVEGLTSASLLRACTSLKSLSLNVNRLSSPAGLVQSTSLVRLGLRLDCETPFSLSAINALFVVGALAFSVLLWLYARIEF